MSTVLDGPATSWLWQTCLQVSWMVVGLLVLQWLLGSRIPAAWRAGLWLLVALRLVTPVLPESTTSVLNLTVPGMATGLRADSATRPRAISRVAVPDIEASVSSAGLIRPPTPHAFHRLQFAALLGWMMVAGLWMARDHVLNRRLGRELGRIVCHQDLDLRIALAGEATALGVRRPPRVLMVEGTVAPALMGGRHATLVVGRALWSRLNELERRHVLRHELTHLRRRDLWIHQMFCLLRALYWFHPLVHLAFARLKLDRELACDAEVLAGLPEQERRAYAASLVKVLKLSLEAPQPECRLAIASVRSATELRVRRILAYHSGDRRQTTHGALAAALLSATCLTAGGDANVSGWQSVSIPRPTHRSAFKLNRLGRPPVTTTDTHGAPLKGRLLVPGAGREAHAAVLLVPGCGGLEDRLLDWAATLRDWGYVVLALDSLGSRDHGDYCGRLASRAVFHSGHFVADAFHALAYLAGQDVVAEDRVAVMGWGPTTTLGTLTRDGLAQVYEGRFRAGVAWTPDCRLGGRPPYYAPTLLLFDRPDTRSAPAECEALLRTGAQGLQLYRRPTHATSATSDTILNEIRNFLDRHLAVPASAHDGREQGA